MWTISIMIPHIFIVTNRDEHINGKKHQANVRAAERKKRADKSGRETNIPPCDLCGMEYFSSRK